MLQRTKLSADISVRYSDLTTFKMARIRLQNTPVKCLVISHLFTLFWRCGM